MMRAYRTLLWGVAFFALQACNPAPEPLVRGRHVAIFPPQVQAENGSVLQVKLPVQVERGYHIQSNPASEKFYLPASLTVNPDNLKVGSIAYPAGRPYHLEGSDRALSVYDGTVVVEFEIDLRQSNTAGEPAFPGKFSYQACDHKTCFPPDTLAFTLQMEN